MKRHGVTVDKTRKYTFEEVRQVCHQYLAPGIEKATKHTLEVCNMAFKDYMLEHGPKGIDIARAQVDFNLLIDKYSEDYENGEFTEAQMKKYNREEA